MRWDAALGPEHRARLVSAFVDRLDRTGLEQTYLGVGSPAHDPALMLKIALYETLQGHRSPAQWARDVRDSDALRWLAQGIQPSRSALYAFRDRLAGPLLEMHAQVIRSAVQQGLITIALVVQDGTSVRARASRHHLFGRDQLAARVEALQAVSAPDPAGAGATPPKWMAPTCRGRQRQLQRYRRVQHAWAACWAAHQKRPKDKQLPLKKVRISLDPEAPLGRDKEKVFGPLYTPQWLVDAGSLLIVAYEVFAQATDAGTLPGMLDRSCAVSGRMPRRVNTDAAYASLLDLQECQRRGVQLIAPIQANTFTAQKRAQAPPRQWGKDHFVWLPQEQTYGCPQGHRLVSRGCERRNRRADHSVVYQIYHCPGAHCRVCPVQAQCVKNPARGRTVKRLQGEELIEAHQAFMQTAEAKALSRLRGSVIERCFGDAKEHRQLRRLHGYGLQRARAEVGLVVLAQTALALERLRKHAANPGENTS